MNRIIALAFAVTLVVAGHMVYAKDNLEVHQASPGEGLTVFVDVSAAGRKKRAAKRMTAMHVAYRAKGWTVIDVEPYIENGDLEGFFVTYVGREDNE